MKLISVRSEFMSWEVTLGSGASPQILVKHLPRGCTQNLGPQHPQVPRYQAQSLNFLLRLPGYHGDTVYVASIWMPTNGTMKCALGPSTTPSSASGSSSSPLVSEKMSPALSEASTLFITISAGRLELRTTVDGEVAVEFPWVPEGYYAPAIMPGWDATTSSSGREDADPNTVLMDLYRARLVSWDAAEAYLRSDGGRRNAMAEAAARDHRDRCRAVLSNFTKGRDVVVAKDTLREHNAHAEQWERQNWDWSQANFWEHEYAAQVHEEAAKGYQEALHNLVGVAVPGPHRSLPAKAQLLLLAGVEGGSQGEYKETVSVREGYSWSMVLEGEMWNKVNNKAKAAVSIAAESAEEDNDMEYGAKMRTAGKFQQHKETAREVSVTIDLGKPCYCYQMQVTVPMEDSTEMTLHGGYFSANRLVPASSFVAGVKSSDFNWTVRRGSLTVGSYRVSAAAADVGESGVSVLQSASSGFPTAIPKTESAALEFFCHVPLASETVRAFSMWATDSRICCSADSHHGRAVHSVQFQSAVEEALAPGAKKTTSLQVWVEVEGCTVKVWSQKQFNQRLGSVPLLEFTWAEGSKDPVQVLTQLEDHMRRQLDYVLRQVKNPNAWQSYRKMVNLLESIARKDHEFATRLLQSFSGRGSLGEVVDRLQERVYWEEEDVTVEKTAKLVGKESAAAAQFKRALEDLAGRLQLPDSPALEAEAALVLLQGVPGDSQGVQDCSTVVRRGYDWPVEIDEGQFKEATERAWVAGCSLALQVQSTDPAAAKALRAAFKNLDLEYGRHEREVVKRRVELGRPFYLYQLVFFIPMEGGGMLTLYGAEVEHNTPISSGPLIKEVRSTSGDWEVRKDGVAGGICVESDPLGLVLNRCLPLSEATALEFVRGDEEEASPSGLSFRLWMDASQGTVVCQTPGGVQAAPVLQPFGPANSVAMEIGAAGLRLSWRSRGGRDMGPCAFVRRPLDRQHLAAEAAAAELSGDEDYWQEMVRRFIVKAREILYQNRPGETLFVVVFESGGPYQLHVHIARDASVQAAHLKTMGSSPRRHAVNHNEAWAVLMFWLKCAPVHETSLVLDWSPLGVIGVPGPSSLEPLASELPTPSPSPGEQGPEGSLEAASEELLRLQRDLMFPTELSATEGEIVTEDLCALGFVRGPQAAVELEGKGVLCGMLPAVAVRLAAREVASEGADGISSVVFKATWTHCRLGLPNENVSGVGALLSTLGEALEECRSQGGGVCVSVFSALLCKNAELVVEANKGKGVWVCLCYFAPLVLIPIPA